MTLSTYDILYDKVHINSTLKLLLFQCTHVTKQIMEDVSIYVKRRALKLFVSAMKISSSTKMGKLAIKVSEIIPPTLVPNLQSFLQYISHEGTLFILFSSHLPILVMGQTNYNQLIHKFPANLRFSRVL